MNPHYLQRAYDWQSAAMTEAYDELPLWSAAPGNLLLEELPYAGVQDALDLACGTGFPLLLLARRLGPRARVTGIDQWEAAIHRAQRKIDAWGMQNVTLVLGDAHTLPFPSESLDLITSNLGLNNFADVPRVMAECHRVLRPSGSLCIATNLHGTFTQFYQAFAKVVEGMPGMPEKVLALEAHRPTLEALVATMTGHGFVVTRTVTEVATITYADGTAFLEDYFTGMGFLPAWKEIVPEAARRSTFDQIETALNALAARSGHLRLTVPIAYLQLQPS